MRLLRAPHQHAWVPIRKGYPQKICRCGAFKARDIKVGENTISFSPVGAGDVARWSATAQPAAAGDLGMDVTTGRPRAFVSQTPRDLATTAEVVRSSRRVALYEFNPDSIVLAQYGDVVQAATGVPTSFEDATGEYINYDTGVVINSDAEWMTTLFTKTQRRWVPSYTAIFKTGTDITSSRSWIGLVSADPMPFPGSLVNSVSIAWDSVSDVTLFWRVKRGDGAAAVTFTTTEPIAADTRYVMVIDCSDTANVKFFINNVLVLTAAATIPVLTANQGWIIGVRNLVAASRSIRIAKATLDME